MAQTDFRSNDRDNNKLNDFWRADIAGLYAITPEGSPEPIQLLDIALAAADDRPVTDMTPFGVRTPKTGYWYRALLHEREQKSDPGRFAAMMHPSEYRGETRYTYIVCEDNTIYRHDLRRTGGVPVYPADAPAQGWSKLD